MTTDSLVFKGMRRLRYQQNGALLSDAMRSPYFWWWSYLRLSQDYWWVCMRNGVADDLRLRKMHTDFGNVYAMSFEQWWEQRGVRLFSEQIELPQVRQIDVADLRIQPDFEKYILLEIPIHLTERTIVSQVRELLRQHPERRVERVSTARRSLAKLIGIRQDVIQTAYEVWHLNYESQGIDTQVTKIGQTRGNKSLYQIGKELRLVKSCMPIATDNEEKATKRVNGMKVAVSRMLKRANHLIDNAAVGVFPSIQQPTTPIVWRAVQQRKLDEAVASGTWRPLFNANHTLNVQ